MLNLPGDIELDVAVRMLLRLFVHQELLPAQFVRVWLPLGLLLKVPPLVHGGQEGRMLRQLLVLQIPLIRCVHTILLEILVGSDLLSILRTVLGCLWLFMCNARSRMIDAMLDDTV